MQHSLNEGVFAWALKLEFVQILSLVVAWSLVIVSQRVTKRNETFLHRFHLREGRYWGDNACVYKLLQTLVKLVQQSILQKFRLQTPHHPLH